MDKLTEWKAHPVIVALISGAAVAVFMLQFIVPIFLKERDVEIADLKKQVVALPGALENVATLGRENKDLKMKVQELLTENVFSFDDVYPKGYRTVRIGDPLAKARELRPSHGIDAAAHPPQLTGRSAFHPAA